jgi:hypothetical protein
MSLVDCPECNGKVSEFADFCPHCGIKKELFESILIQKEKEKQEILSAQEKDHREKIDRVKKFPEPIQYRLIRASFWALGMFVICPKIVVSYLVSQAVSYTFVDGRTINLAEHPLGPIIIDLLTLQGFRGWFNDDIVSACSSWLLAFILYAIVYEVIFRFFTKSRSKEKSKSNRAWRKP